MGKRGERREQNRRKKQRIKGVLKMKSYGDGEGLGGWEVIKFLKYIPVLPTIHIIQRTYLTLHG